MSGGIVQYCRSDFAFFSCSNVLCTNERGPYVLELSIFLTGAIGEFSITDFELAHDKSE